MPNPTAEAELVLSKLDGVRADAKGWSARCPCRDGDVNPSLHVGVGNNGAVMLRCHRGASACSTDQICDAMGLKMSDLFPPNEDFRNEKRELVGTYRYFDQNGEMLFEKLKYMQGGKKQFTQRRREGDDWVYNLDGVPKILYNLPKVLQAVANGNKIAVVEGEKDADAIIAAGFVATTMPGGAGKWLDIHTEALAGGRITVIQDNDEIGEEHAKHVVKVLTEAGCEVSHKRAPAPHKDVADMLGAGLTLADLEEVIPDPIDVFIENVRKIQERGLSPQQSMIRISNLLETASSNDYSPLLGGGPQNWEHWLRTVDHSYDWIIRDLLERMERVICVAAEGAGKSFLMRQVAILAAAGIHPFTFARIDPIVTLSVDLENPDRILARTSERIMNMARERTWLAKSTDINAFIKALPGGMNLFDPRARAEVEAWVADIRPDIIFFGPLYKSYIEQSGRSEQAMATELAMFFDYLRYEYNCALWMEQHAPLGNSVSGRDLRPFGSSVWSRWPEFGMSMALDPLVKGSYKIDWFRGSRDERMWPEAMHRGQVGTDFPFVVDKFREYTAR